MRIINNKNMKSNVSKYLPITLASRGIYFNFNKTCNIYISSSNVLIACVAFYQQMRDTYYYFVKLAITELHN